MGMVQGKALNKVNVEVDFSANTSKAQKEIQNLQKQLNDLLKEASKSTGTFELDDELRKASNAAIELKRHLNNAMNVDTGQFDVGALDKSFKRAGKTLDDYRVSLSKLKGGDQVFSSIAKSILNAEVPLKRSSKLLSEFTTTLKNTARWQISSSILHGFMGSLQSAFGYAKDLNESLNNIRIVTGQSTDQMADFAVEANKAAQALSTTTTKYTDAALIYYQQGLSDEEVKKRTDVTIKMANVSRQSAEEVSSQMTAVWNNFNKTGDQSEEHFADIMTKLGAETASSSAEIAEGLSKFAGIADTVGLSFDYAASALATITATSRESADVVGTSLKTIFSRLEGLKLGKTLEDDTDLNQYSQALAKIGVNIKDASGELKDMDTILDETGEKWQNLTQDQKMATAQTVAGVRQYNQFITLMDNWDFMEKNIQRSREATGTLQEQADIYADSWEAAEKRVTAAAEEIYSKLLSDDFFIGMNNGIADFLNGISNTIDALGGLQGVISGLGLLITTLYKDQLANTLNNFFTTQKQRQAEWLNAQQQALTGLFDSMTAQSLPEAGAAYNSILTATEELVANSKNLTAEQEEQLRLELQQLQNRAKMVEEYEKEARLAEQIAENAEITANKAKNRLSNLSTERKQTADDILKNTNEDSRIDVKNAMGEFDQWIEGQKAFTEETIKASSAYEKLVQVMNGDEKSANKYVESKMAEVNAIKNVEQAVENENKAKNDAVIANETVAASQADLNASTEDFIEKTGKEQIKVMEMGDVVVGLSQGLMSLSMAWSSLKGLGSIWSDQDISVGEKIFSTVSSLAMALPLMIDGFKSAKKAISGFGPAIMEMAGKIIAAQAAETGATAASLTFGAALKTVATSALTAVAPFAAIIAAVVGLGLVISEISAEWNKAENNAKKAAEVADEVSKSYEKVKTSYEDLKSSLEQYNEAKNALSELTTGTQEWRDAVFELNEQVLKLIETYPELAKFVSNKNGILELNDAGQSALLEAQQGIVQTTSQTESLTQINKLLSQNTSDYTKFSRSNDTNYDENGQVRWGATAEQVKTIVETLAKDNSLKANSAELAKITSLPEEIIKAVVNNPEVDKLVDSAKTNLEAVNVYKDQLAESLKESLDLSGSKDEETLSKAASEKATTFFVGEMASLLNNLDEDEIKKQYKTLTHSAEELEDISLETAASYLAMQEATKGVTSSLDAMKSGLNKLDGALGKVAAGEKDAGKYSAKDIEELQGKTFENLSLTDSEKQALGLTPEVWNETLAAVNSAYQLESSKLKEDMIESTKKIFEGLGNLDEVTIDSQKAIAEALNKAIIMGGKQAQESLETLLDDANSKDKLDELGEVLANIGDTTDVDTLKDSLKEVGITTNLTDTEFNNLINSMQNVSANTENLATKYAEIHKIMDSLTDGATISAEDYQKLGDAAKGYFAQMLDGTYKLIGSAEEFKKRTQENLVAQAQANIEDLKYKKQGMKRLEGYDFEGLAQASITTQRRYNGSSLEDTGHLSSKDAITVQRQIDLVQELGDASYETQKKIQGWIEASKKNTFTKDMLKDINGEVQKLTEQYPSLKDAIESTNAEIQQQRLAIALTATSMRELDDLLEQGSINQAAYDQALLQMHTEERMEGLDTEEIKNYSNYLQDLAENIEDAKIGSDKLSESLADNRDVAEDITIQIARMNGAVETLADNWKEWSEILRTSSIGSEEYHQAQLGVKKALADLFDVSEDYISLELVDEFAKDEEAMKLMAKAAKGDGDAIDELRERASADIIAKIKLDDNIDTGEFNDAWKKIQEELEKNSSDFNVAVGAEIKNESFIDALQQMVDKAGLSVDQINTVLSSMGYEAQFEADDQVMQTKVPVITKKHTVIPGDPVETYDDKGFKTGEAPTWTETEEVTGVTESTQDVSVPAWALGTVVPGKPTKKPTIKSVHKKANGSANNFSKSNPGGKAPGKKSGKKGKGGGKQKKEKTPQYSDEFDRYWQLNQTIKKTSDALNELGKAQEYAFGNAKIKNIKKQNALLQVQLKNVRALHKAQIKERNRELQKQGKKKYGAKFDKDGYLANYNKITHKELKRYTKALKSGNEKTIEAAKNRYEAFKKWLNRYEKLTQDELVNSKEQIKEILRQIVEGNISKIETKFQFDVDTREAKRTWDKFLKDISNGLKNTFSAFKDYSFFGDALDNDVKIVKDKAKEVKDAVEWANRYNDIYKNWDTYVKKTPEKDRIASSKSEAKKLRDQYREKAEMAGRDALSALQDGLSQITGYIQEFGNKLDFINKEFQEQQDILNYNKELIELTYGDKAYDLMESYYNAQGTLLENQKESLETQKNTYEEIWKKDKEVQAARGVVWDPNNMETWSDAGVEAYNKMIDCSKELRNVNLELVKTLKEDYLNAVSKVIDEHERLVTGGLSLDEASEQWERVREEADHYLDATERTYQVQTLMNKIDQSISDTKSVKAAKQLNELREKELKYLSEKDKLTKYDLDAANARYNIALKEIALQEAQNNKNTMKLTRNEQGNWTYQYVASQDDIKAKEQELMDANYNYYEMAKSNYMSSIEDMTNLEKEYSRQLYEIESIRFTNEEEYNRKKDALNKWYEEKRKRIIEENSLFQQDMIIAGTSVLQTQYDIDKGAFEQLNADKLGFIEKLKENGTTNFQELFDAFGGYSEKAGERMVTAILGGDKDKTKAAFPQVTQGLINLVESAKTSLIGEKTSLSKVFESAGQTIINNWRNNPDGIEQQLKTSYNELDKKAQDISKKIIEITGGDTGIKNAFEKAAGKAKSLNTQTNTFCTKVKKEFPNLIKQIKNLASAYDKVAKAANSSKKAVVELNKAVKNTKPPKVGKDTKPETYTVPSSSSSSNSSSSNKGKTTPKVTKKKKPTKASKDGYRLQAGSFTGHGGTPEYVIRDKSGNMIKNTGYTDKKKAKKIANEWAKKNGYKSFATGGYTGSWGDAGKLAVLHQKELVLNKEDTANMLDAVKAIREVKDLNSSISKTISDSLGSIVLNAMQTMKSGTLVNTDKDKSQQGIVIENITAEFPNAENVNEIRQAILSLPQLASQYVSRNLK